MSVALVQAIYARLAGTETPALTGTFLTTQQKVKQVLAEDTKTRVGGVPGTGRPAIIYQNMTQEVVFPRFVYRQALGVSDIRFGEGFAVGYPLFEFEVWTQERSAFTLFRIMEYVSILFDVRLEAPPLPMAKGKFFHAQPFSEAESGFDDKRNEWFLRQRWEFCEAQY